MKGLRADNLKVENDLEAMKEEILSMKDCKSRTAEVGILLAVFVSINGLLIIKLVLPADICLCDYCKL